MNKNVVMLNDHDGNINYPTISDDEFNLTITGVLRFYQNIIKNQDMLDFLMKMDKQDKWTVDYSESVESMAEIRVFYSEFESLVKSYSDFFHHDQVLDSFLWLLAHLKSARCLYVLKYVVDSNPQFLSYFNQYQETPEKITIEKRLQAFHRANLLSRIFSNVRLQEINLLLKDKKV